MSIPSGFGPPTGNQLRDFGKHVAEKTPQGATQKDIQYHIDHHAPGADKADPTKFQSAVFTQINFTKIDTNKDQKVTTNEINSFASKFPPGPPPPPAMKPPAPAPAPAANPGGGAPGGKAGGGPPGK